MPNVALSIVWSGVTYYKKHGRVSAVFRTGACVPCAAYARLHTRTVPCVRTLGDAAACTHTHKLLDTQITVHTVPGMTDAIHPQYTRVGADGNLYSKDIDQARAAAQTALAAL